LDANRSQKVHRSHYPPFPENGGSVRYAKVSLPRSDTILHKTPVNRLSSYGVSNPSLRRKLPPVDVTMTNRRTAGIRPRFGQSYSGHRKKASLKRLHARNRLLKEGLVTSDCRDHRGRHDLHDRRGPVHRRHHVRPVHRHRHQSRGRHLRLRAAPAGALH
jgi:hypothetical protein